MKRTAVRCFLAFALLCVCFMPSCASAPEGDVRSGREEAAPEPSAPAGGAPLKLVRHEEVMDDSLVLIYPQAEDEGESLSALNGAVKGAMSEMLKERGRGAYTYFRVQCNQDGILSLLVDCVDSVSNEVVEKRAFTFDTASGKSIDIEDCFLEGEGAWRAVLPDIVTAIAKKRGMTLLSEVMPIRDGQMFYLTGQAVTLVYRPYEISTYAAQWPEFYIPFASVAQYIDPAGPLGVLAGEAAGQES